MALTTGMLERFKNLASDKDGQLLKINMTDLAIVYGYLREVGSDYFVIDEVESKIIDKDSDDRYSRSPNWEYSTENKGRSVLSLELIKSWTEIGLDLLPGSGIYAV